MLKIQHSTAILICGLTMVWTFAFVPNHGQPCIQGDAWAEECKSCYCDERNIVRCRPTLCSSKLQTIDNCKEGEITKVLCNTCVCHKNVRECTKKHCPKKQ